MKKEKVLHYTANNNGREKHSIHKNKNGHMTLKSVVWTAMTKKKRNKAAVTVEYVIKMLTVWDELRIDKVTEEIN